MNLYKVYCPKIAGSGFVIYLVCADSEELAELEIRKNTHYHLGILVTKIDIYNDKNHCVVEMINYDDPSYEG